MEIGIDRPRGVELSSLYVGDVVEYKDEYYMLTNNKDYSKGAWVCVLLRTGELTSIPFDATVTRLDTILHLNE